jgi:hypothetical protein
MIMLGDMERGAALVAQNLEVKRGRFRYLGDYGSSIRDRAMAMDAVLRSEGVPAELIEQVLTMLGPLGADLNILSRLSPQEHAVLFKLSMSIAALDLGAAFQGVIEIATQQIDGGYADDNYGLGSTKVTLLTGNGVRTQTVDGVKDGDAVSFVNNGERAIFASLTWSGVAREFQAEVFNGIRVISDSYRIVGSRSELLQAGAALEPGDIILTRVRMVSVEDVADALLVHLLPAGLELENQNLSHSLKLEDVRLIGVPIAQKADILHEEYRDDRYVAALTLRKDREVLVYYLARAVVPGTYVVPPARVESMYTPALNGIGNTIGKLTVGR